MFHPISLANIVALRFTYDGETVHGGEDETPESVCICRVATLFEMIAKMTDAS